MGLLESAQTSRSEVSQGPAPRPKAQAWARPDRPEPIQTPHGEDLLGLRGPRGSGLLLLQSLHRSSPLSCPGGSCLSKSRPELHGTPWKVLGRGPPGAVGGCERWQAGRHQRGQARNGEGSTEMRSQEGLRCGGGVGRMPTSPKRRHPRGPTWCCQRAGREHRRVCDGLDGWPCPSLSRSSSQGQASWAARGPPSPPPGVPGPVSPL